MAAHERLDERGRLLRADELALVVPDAHARLELRRRALRLGAAQVERVVNSPLLATVTLMLEVQLMRLLSLRCALGGRETETSLLAPSIRERSSASLAAET